MYNKSLAITIKSRGRNHPEIGKLYANLGMVYNIRKNSLVAVSYYQKALRIYTRVIGESSLPVAVVYNNLGNIYEYNGDFERAITYYTNAANIFFAKSGPYHPLLAVIYGNIGVSYHYMGDPDKAIENYHKALQVSSRVAHPVEGASIYNNLGRAFGIKGDFKKALVYCNKALRLYAASADEEAFQLGIATCYSNMAEVYMQQKAFAQAVSHFKQGLTRYVHMYGQNNPHVTEVLIQIGNGWLGQNHLDSAHFYLDQSIQTMLPRHAPGALPSLSDVQSVPAKKQLSRALAAKADAYREQYAADPHNTGALRSALHFYEVAVQVIDLLRRTYKGEEAKLFLSDHSNLVYQRGLETAFLLYQQTRDPGYLDKAFVFSEKGKASVLLEVTKQIGAEYTAGIPDSVWVRENALRAEVIFLENQAAAPLHQDHPGTSNMEQLQGKIAEAKRHYSEFMEHMEEAYPDYYRLKYSNTVARISDVQKHLLPKQALLAYTLTDSSVYVFCVTTTGQSLTRVNADGLVQRVQTLREALKTNKRPVYAHEANALFNTLIAPVQRQLAGIGKLIIVRDGELSYIPFEILLSETPALQPAGYSDLSYLLREYQMSYHYSATLLLEHRNGPHQKARKGLLGLAPSFGKAVAGPLQGNQPTDGLLTQPASQLTPLRGAREEVKKIAQQFKGDYFLDAAATKSQFTKLAPGYAVVLLATHALIDDQHPNLSKLAFAPEGPSGGDRFLYAYELYNLKLRAELVTLSACNTGIGKLQRGEGVISLARGFAYAGCPTIVVSLWPAADQPTSRIMRYFYEGLRQGLTKDDALYRAKIKYLQSADEYQTNPAFWGSFVLIGNVQPLQVQILATPWMLVAGLAVLLLSGLAGAKWARTRKQRRGK